MGLTYVCSPLSAPTRAEMLANAAKANTYMVKAEKEFGDRAVAPHAYLPYLLDDTVAEERALALEFDTKLLKLCTRLVVYGDVISSGMHVEIEEAITALTSWIWHCIDQMRKRSLQVSSLLRRGHTND